MNYADLKMGNHVWWVNHLTDENCPEMPEKYTVVKVDRSGFIYLVPGEGIVHGSKIEHRGPTHAWLFPTAKEAWEAYAAAFISWNVRRWQAIGGDDDGLSFNLKSLELEVAEMEPRAICEDCVSRA